MAVIRHTGIVVKDMNQSLKFYRDLLNFEVIKDCKEDSKFIDKLLLLENSRLQTVKLKDDKGNIIELLKFDLPNSTFPYAMGQIFDIGCSHIAFTVNDVDKEYERLIKKDIEFNSTPQISSDGDAKVVFCSAPEGTYIELVEELKSLSLNSDYISSIYDMNSHPITKYPYQLCEYLIKRFRIKNGQKLLDVGCGRGDFTSNFKKLGLSVSGIDISYHDSTFLEGIKIKHCNFENEPFPFEDNTFDIVFSKSVIEHLNNPTNYLKEIHRVLKKDGVIIIMAPDWVSQMKIYYDDWTHKTPYTIKSVNDALKMFGFRDIKTELFYQLPILWRFPSLKILSWYIRHIIPITFKTKIKFIRWSREQMILAYGRK